MDFVQGNLLNIKRFVDSGERVRPHTFSFLFEKDFLDPGSKENLLKLLLEALEFNSCYTPYEQHQFFKEILCLDPKGAWVEKLSDLKVYYYGAGMPAWKDVHELKKLSQAVGQAICENIGAIFKHYPSLGWVNLHFNFNHPLVSCDDVSVKRLERLVERYPSWPFMQENFFYFHSNLLEFYARRKQWACVRLLLDSLDGINFEAASTQFFEETELQLPREEWTAALFCSASEYVDAVSEGLSGDEASETFNQEVRWSPLRSSWIKACARVPISSFGLGEDQGALPA